ncbi:MAG: cupin domain-containing protein [Candidatus Bathyarchaeota archaeon]|jgi:quercetin dioxygenase-like cupin family protein
MHVTNISNFEDVKLDMKGASGVKIKYLFHADVDAERLQLRLFAIEVGGNTPFEKHIHEHHIFMLKGEALVKGADTEAIVGEGDVIFIQSWEEHQFKNIGEEELQFLCTKKTYRI